MMVCFNCIRATFSVNYFCPLQFQIRRFIRVAFDQVELSSTEPREKLAVSYAFAQSCNLA